MINENEVIQSETLKELKDILEDEFDVLVSSYLEDAQSRLDKLAAAIQQSDAAVIKAEAHSLKGSSLNLGASGLAELCSLLEKCGNTGELGEAVTLFAKTEAEFCKAKTVLESYSKAL